MIMEIDLTLQVIFIVMVNFFNVNGSCQICNNSAKNICSFDYYLTGIHNVNENAINCLNK